MKILHLPYGIGISTLSQALRKQGVDAASCSLRYNRYSYMADTQLYLAHYPRQQAEKMRDAFFEEALHKYDIFHFHFGETFYPDKRDLKILKDHGKKLIVNHRGSEVRMLSVARSFENPYVTVKHSWVDEEKIHNNLKQLSQYIDHAIVNDYELHAYVAPYYKKVHILPHAIDTGKFQPHYPLEGARPLLIHAPTHREIKGSNYIVAAVEHLQNEGFEFDFKLIENLAHLEAMELYEKATLVIDQLLIGAYGHLSVESMAMGKPVICYIRNDLRPKYPAELPVISANPDTIYSTLKSLLSNPGYFKTIGERGRAFVQQYHDMDAVAQKLINIYKEL
ncbi:glycosyltransferase family protein [Paenibacillus sp. CAU 1782]